MKHLSLHVKLRNLVEAGALTVEQDYELRHVLKGEGSYRFKNKRIEVFSPYDPATAPKDLKELIRNLQVTFAVPHDVAWSPSEKVLLAYAPTEHDQFTVMPDNLRKLVKNFRQKQLS